MVVVCCSVTGCTYRTADEEPSIVTVLLQLHLTEHSSSSSKISAPKLERPQVDTGVNQEAWNAFVLRWEAYKAGSHISDEDASIQLFQCAGQNLTNVLLRSNRRITAQHVDEVLSAMRTLAVIPVARGVTRAELLRMNQANDESFRLFAARVRGKAETCGFVTDEGAVDYTEEVIRDVVLSGIRDLDIRREALSTEGLQSKRVNEIISFVESREMASHAVTPCPEESSMSIAAMSSFKRASGKPPSFKDDHRSRTATCPGCGETFNVFKLSKRGWNRRPYTICLQCWRSKRTSTDGKGKLSLLLSNPYDSQISTLHVKSELGHRVFRHGAWEDAKFRQHPVVSLMLSIDGKGTSVSLTGVADTGAQCNIWSYTKFLEAGFNKCELYPVSSCFKVADKRRINIVGAFPGKFSGLSPNGSNVVCRAMVYVSTSIAGFYLSWDTMEDLGVLPKSFPTIGEYLVDINHATEGDLNEIDADVCLASINGNACDCPERSPVPSRPTQLPFEPIPGNIPKMREWILDRYASSTFNTCPHRPLQQMEGPPIEIHVSDSAVPRVCHTPAPIPLHWQEKVREDILRDEALGIIEEVPYGVPVTWCHRMVITRKHDGTPRRTVDLSPLNRYCRRESFYSESPFILARRVPGDTWKSVADAWNGYHSVPLRESDRHLTTFITPFGRYRYTRAPQGFLSSGDGYNRRFDAVLSEFLRKERCVDDTVFYDNDLVSHWWRVIDFLSIIGNAGIVLNKEKFQFSQRQVDFAGFRISEKRIEPLPRYLDAIRSFPTPKGITDIRSWFGLVNQVSNYAQLRDMMEPFRKFLSPKNKFYWDHKLNDAFVKSKSAIVNAIHNGVRIFDISKPTCLRTDWSERGLGYFLLQKHCKCESELPDCCPAGWSITLAGSRFLNGSEKNYPAIDGEALAITWALEQTKFFTQGCDNLLVVTDHRPLVKILDVNTPLDEMPSTRLFRSKHKTLRWRYKIAYLPGKTNHAADAASRYPSTKMNIETTPSDEHQESFLMNSIIAEASDMMAIPWDRIVRGTSNDRSMLTLIRAIREGFVGSYTAIEAYMRYRQALTVSDGVVFYQDRVVVPPSLRKVVLENLHSAHQGVASMLSRAQRIVFWPGITLDIQRIRNECQHCNRNAPSQASLPAENITPPTTPFQQVFSDFFEFAGKHYLIVGDRLSGWTEVYSTPFGSQRSGAKGLVSCLRQYFTTFGVPEELASDGGPEFTADTTQSFLRRWDIRHRLSSAYFPQSNGRAEVAVKSAKRLLRANVGPTGSLDNDRFMRAMLQLHNTPDPDCNVSPSEVIFGKPIRDAFSFSNRAQFLSHSTIGPQWKDAWKRKELALRKRYVQWRERYNTRTKDLKPLKVGDTVFIQNQVGPYSKKWDRTGLITEVWPHRKYTVKIDGSGRTSKRNRKFLRLYQPASLSYTNPLFLQSNKPEESISITPPVSVPTSIPDPIEDSPDQPQPRESEERIPREEEVVEEPVEDPDNLSKKLPLALRRLQMHNKPGLLDPIAPPTSRLRERR